MHAAGRFTFLPSVSKYATVHPLVKNHVQDFSLTTNILPPHRLRSPIKQGIECPISIFLLARSGENTSRDREREGVRRGRYIMRERRFICIECISLSILYVIDVVPKGWKCWWASCCEEMGKQERKEKDNV